MKYTVFQDAWRRILETGDVFRLGAYTPEEDNYYIYLMNCKMPDSLNSEEGYMLFNIKYNDVVRISNRQFDSQKVYKCSIDLRIEDNHD